MVEAFLRRKTNQVANTPTIAAAGIPTPSPIFAVSLKSGELCDVASDVVVLAEGLETAGVGDNCALVVAPLEALDVLVKALESLVEALSRSADVMLK